MLNKIKNSIAILLLTFVLLFGYFFHKSSSVSFDRASCTIKDGQCEIITDKDSITLSFFPKSIELEEEIRLKVSYPEELTLSSTQITGINMYMGRIPVIFDLNEAGSAHGTFFLGSCSEPNMRWQMEFVFTDGQGAKSTYFAMFATSRE